jgi:uncharacterized protein (TIGR00299 family) protein
MSKAIFLGSVAGVAGDMFAAAFVDAGLVSIEQLDRLTQSLGLTGVRVLSESVIRATVKATRISVVCDTDEWRQQFSAGHGQGDHHHHHHDNTNLILEEKQEHWHVHYGEIDRFIERSSLDEGVRDRARGIFKLLGEAEASVHDIELDRAAFHELGTIDSILDVVMAAYCVEKVGAAEFFATPIKPGRGLIKIAHGTHPVPPPATTKLLIGLPVVPTPAAIADENIELSTPTGVAILRSLEPRFVNEIPAGVITAAGRGSGTRDLGNYPNVFSVAVLERAESATDLPYFTDKVFEIVCNIDDDTGEHLAWMCEQLLSLGALDVWQTPGTGKKGRSMVCLSVLATRADLGKLADWMLQNGTTFGLRYQEWDRLKLSPEFEERDHDGIKVKYKIGKDITGKTVKEKQEFDSWKSGR